MRYSWSLLSVLGASWDVLLPICFIYSTYFFRWSDDCVQIFFFTFFFSNQNWGPKIENGRTRLTKNIIIPNDKPTAKADVDS